MKKGSDFCEDDFKHSCIIGQKELPQTRKNENHFS
jgi:hypothetical protein